MKNIYEHYQSKFRSSRSSKRSIHRENRSKPWNEVTDPTEVSKMGSIFKRYLSRSRSPVHMGSEMWSSQSTLRETLNQING